MEIRKVSPGDADRLTKFFAEVPEDDRTFFKEDLTDPDTMRSFTSVDRGLRLIALDDAGEIGGYVRVLPGTGLSSHVGEIRLVVAANHRRAGFGRNLARRALVDSVRELGLRKLFVEVAAEQEPSIRMFQKIGFTPEAILRDHLRDRRGKMQDLVLLCHLVEDNWAGLRGLGVDHEVG